MRGSCCSYQMPWEDILRDLERNCLDKGLLEIPRPQDCLKYLLRAHITVGTVDLKKCLKQLHVRPYVLLLLLDWLIDQNHEVFRGKGSAVVLKQKMREAVAREYPEGEGDVPEANRAGHGIFVMRGMCIFIYLSCSFFCVFVVYLGCTWVLDL